MAVAYLEHRVLPNLADNGAVGLFGLCGLAYKRKHIVGKLVGNIKPPAGSAAPEPQLNYAVLCADDVILPACVLLVYLGQILKVPPAAVIVGEGAEVKPVKILRSLARVRADAAVAAEAVKINAVRARVRENAVIYDFYTEPFGLGTKVYIIIDAAQYRVNVFVV